MVLCFSFLCQQVQCEVLEGEREGRVPQVLWDMLRGVQLRALGDVRQQGRVPVLQGQDHRHWQEKEVQVPLSHGLRLVLRLLRSTRCT